MKEAAKAGKAGKRKHKQPVSLERLIVLMICLIVFFGAGAYIGFYFMDIHKAQIGFAQVNEQKSEISLEDIHAQNPDTIGWVKIQDTHINYPVMQTVKEPEFYLHRNFKKEESASGTPFMDADCSVGKRSGEGASWNWMIYGHNMKSGTMFHDLLKYENREFRESHRTFKLEIIRSGGVETYEIEVFAAARARILTSDEEGFRYYRYTGFTDEESFNEYVAGVQRQSCIKTGITPEYGQQLVTLSTCAYHTAAGRFYVVGVVR